MAQYQRTFATPCTSKLVESINEDGAITPVLTQLIDLGDGGTIFEFASDLDAGDVTALDAILAGWSCPVVALELNYIDDDKESSTTSRKWVQKLSLEFRALDGDYLIEWSAEARASKDKTKAAFQCELDNSIKINSGNARLDGTGFLPFNGFKKLTLTAGVHTVDIDYMCGQSKRVVYIQNARIKITQL